MKVIPSGEQVAPWLRQFARKCGRVLARAHATTGDAVAIDAYLGKGRDVRRGDAQLRPGLRRAERPRPRPARRRHRRRRRSTARRAGDRVASGDERLGPAADDLVDGRGRRRGPTSRATARCSASPATTRRTARWPDAASGPDRSNRRSSAAGSTGSCKATSSARTSRSTTPAHRGADLGAFRSTLLVSYAAEMTIGVAWWRRVRTQVAWRLEQSNFDRSYIPDDAMDPLTTASTASARNGVGKASELHRREFSVMTGTVAGRSGVDIREPRFRRRP